MTKAQFHTRSRSKETKNSFENNSYADRLAAWRRKSVRFAGEKKVLDGLKRRMLCGTSRSSLRKRDLQSIRRSGRRTGT